MSSLNPLFRRLICTAALLLSALGHARADGAHIALHTTRGACTVTLFTAPEPLVSGPADLSLLVQDAATGEVLSDATATGTLAHDGAEPLSFALTHALAGNKLLLAAAPVFAQPGNYTLTLRVERNGAAPATVTTVLAVAPDHRRRTTLLFALVLPLAAILLFLVNQYSKDKRRPSRPALH